MYVALRLLTGFFSIGYLTPDVLQRTSLVGFKPPANYALTVVITDGYV
jgi:hypothetical protein